jgi:hypothetical protein
MGSCRVVRFTHMIHDQLYRHGPAVCRASHGDGTARAVFVDGRDEPGHDQRLSRLYGV